MESLGGREGEGGRESDIERDQGGGGGGGGRGRHGESK